MVEEKMMRLSQAARKLNVGISTITAHLTNKGYEVESSPNAKITPEQFNLLSKEFASSALEKEEASGLTIGTKHTENLVIDTESDKGKKEDKEEEEFFIKGISGEPAVKPSETDESETAETEKVQQNEDVDQEKEEEKKDDSSVETPRLQGIKVVGKIDLDSKPAKKKPEPKEEKVEEKKEAPQKVEEKAEKTEKVEAEKKEAEKEAVEAPPQTEAPKKEEVAKEEIPQETQEEEVKEVEAKEETTEKPQEEAPKKEEATQEELSETQEEEEKPKDKKGKIIEARAEQLKGLTVVGKIDLPTESKKQTEKPVASSDEKKKKRKRRRRIKVKDENKSVAARGNKKEDKKGSKGGKKRKGAQREEVSEQEVQAQLKETLAKISTGGKRSTKGARSRYERRKADAREREEQRLAEESSKVLQVTEFISANDLASMMDVSVNEVISICMSLGMFVSINQRLDAESITVIADEFGYEVEFVDAEDEITVKEEKDTAEELTDRAPIVTIMGHVDHGKTSLLDYIRKAKVTEGEAGGITQHIGAYDVMTNSGKRIAFLDTPGHEAFTAMRARGAKVTDVVIVVVAADDSVMPQTKEALNHAQVAGVPIVIAINKVDKPNADVNKIKEQLSNINILVEDWGGKYQCQEISAKTGQGIDDLLEKVLLEAELLELKANAEKYAVGTVIEATLDRGRGYVTTLLVQGGTLTVGDVVLAGAHYGKVKAMFDHRGKRLEKAEPSTPVQMLGLDGAPQAGDKFNVMETDREAREIANKREQIIREQSLRVKKHITLDEIGRRLAIGSFRELNIIVKGDVDGSIEALSDSLLKLSTEEVQVNIIHKAVGQISESDVLLASASDAVIVGFQVRPSGSARNLAEKEEIEIRLYSVIYDAINDVKDAMEGMLAPSVEEVITGNAEVRQVFKITKIGTVAGCYMTDGSIKRSAQVRVVRDGIVAYTGEINQLKREKDDVAEVRSGFECGISIKNFNDLKVGDVIEGFEQKEVKRTL